MSDQYREPIEETIDLKVKFIGGGESKPISRTKTQSVEKKERTQTEKEGAYAAMLSRVQNDDSDDDASDKHAHTVARDAHHGASEPDVESQITHLIDLATTKGVTHAVKVAQHMSDYYVLDTMHDKMLADQFFDALNKKGLL